MALLHLEPRQHPALHLPAGASPPAAAEIALSWMQCVCVCVCVWGGGGAVTRKRADCNGNICLFGGAASCKCRWGLIAQCSAPENVALHSEPGRQEITSARCGPANGPLPPSQTFIKPSGPKHLQSRPSALFFPALQRGLLCLNSLNQICVGQPRAGPDPHCCFGQ